MPNQLQMVEKEKITHFIEFGNEVPLLCVKAQVVPAVRG